MATPFPFVAGNVLTAAQLNSITELIINDKTASYVLVAGDAGERVIMNSASATTITVNNSIFAAGQMVFLANKGAGTCTITAGAGVTINVNGSLALAQYGGGTLLATSASTFIFFPAGSVSYGSATGGSSSSITVGGINYTLLTFTSDGTLTVNKAGYFDLLLVGGGGSGGGGAPSGNSAGGGGGGGDVVGLDVLCRVYLDATTYSVDVGAGGAANFTGGGSGSGARSTLAGIVAIGGGTGGDTSNRTDDAAYLRVGSNGGSAGGSAATYDNVQVTAMGYKGNNGGYGDAIISANGTGAGGGGGAGGAGGNGTATVGGAGGNGADISGFIGGATYYVAAGGGGAANGTGGAAGNGGVAGQGTNAVGNNGVNYGAGGGGGKSNGTVLAGGNGQAGVVYVRFAA